MNLEQFYDKLKKTDIWGEGFWQGLVDLIMASNAYPYYKIMYIELALKGAIYNLPQRLNMSKSKSAMTTVMEEKKQKLQALCRELMKVTP